MERFLIVSTVIAVIYSLVKYIESRYIEHTTIPLKLVVRDIILVFGCSSVTLFFAFYVEGPLGYFFSMVSNRPIAPTSASVAAAVYTSPPDF